MHRPPFCQFWFQIPNISLLGSGFSLPLALLLASPHSQTCGRTTAFPLTRCDIFLLLGPEKTWRSPRLFFLPHSSIVLISRSLRLWKRTQTWSLFTSRLLRWVSAPSSLAWIIIIAYQPPGLLPAWSPCLCHWLQIIYSQQHLIWSFENIHLIILENLLLWKSQRKSHSPSRLWSSRLPRTPLTSICSSHSSLFSSRTGLAFLQTCQVLYTRKLFFRCLYVCLLHLLHIFAQMLSLQLVLFKSFCFKFSIVLPSSSILKNVFFSLLVSPIEIFTWFGLLLYLQCVE